MNAAQTIVDAHSLRSLFDEKTGHFGWSAHMAAQRLRWGRPEASGFFQRCRRRGWVVHDDGAWRLTDAGRAALWLTPTGRAEP